MSRVFVTGMGIISPLGDNVSDNRHALINGQGGISILSQFPSRFAGHLPCGEIKTNTETLKQNLGITTICGVTRTSVLALHAFKEAIHNAQLTSEQLQSSGTALIGASTVGGMCLTDELYRDANNHTGKGSEYISSYDNSSATLFLQSEYKIGGIVNTINTACSSSANSIMFGAMLIKNGFAKRAIVGGADSLAKFTINGFNSLFILSSDPCTPFDKGRKGLNLGEAAGFLVLEKEEDINGKKVYAELAGYGNSNDSFHASSISDSGDGPYLCMQRALQTAQLDAKDIDLINAHGTATENNDETESQAMIRLFETPPPFISTKSYTGHTLGAAGAIEAIYSILKLHHQEIYPSLHFKEPIESTGLVPQLHYKQMQVKHVMSNSFGFGGNCSSLIFSKS